MADLGAMVVRGFASGVAAGASFLKDAITGAVGIGAAASAAPVIEALSFPARLSANLAISPSPSNLRLMADICYFATFPSPFPYFDNDPFYNTYRPANQNDKNQTFPDIRKMSGKDLLKEYEQYQIEIEKYRGDLLSMRQRLGNPNLKPPLTKAELQEFEQKFMIVQGLIKRSSAIVNHCAQMQSDPTYRLETEQLQHPNIKDPKVRKGLKDLLKDNTEKYLKITTLASANQPLLQQQIKSFNEISQLKQAFDAQMRSADLAAKMGNVHGAGENSSRTLATPAKASKGEPKKGLFNLFKADANVIKTMTTQLKIGEEKLKEFLGILEKDHKNVDVKRDETGQMKMESANSVALCEAAKFAATYAKDTIFDLTSPSEDAAFKILQEALKPDKNGVVINIGKVTFQDAEGKDVVLEGKAIEKFVQRLTTPKTGPATPPPEPGGHKPEKPGGSRPGQG